MKTSNVLASLLFGSIAAAAPLNKRALATTTEVVWETVLVYTTVWDGEAPKTEAQVEATSSAGLFYEKPSNRPAAQPTHVYTPPAAKPSSVYTPAPKPSTHEPEVQPEPTSVYTPAPEAPKQTSVYSAPAQEAPKPSSVAPVEPKPSAPANNGNSQNYNGDITIYDVVKGNFGACGNALPGDDENKFIVALAKPTWGESTYDVMTGESSNPWCGKTISIEYNGNTIEAEIQDMCPECAAGDIDLNYPAWKALTGTTEKTHYQASWHLA